jgi:hypothetical protein
MVVVRVDTSRLFKGVRVAELTDQNTLQAIADALRQARVDFWKVTRVESMLAPGESRIEAVLYVILLTQPPALPSPEDAQAPLSDGVEIELIGQHIGECLWLNGHDGIRFVFSPLHGIKHMLYAGSTQFGKTASLYSSLAALLFNNGPDLVRVGVIDPKGVDSAWLDACPHLIAPPVTDAKDLKGAGQLLYLATQEMDRRKGLIRGVASNLPDYNAKRPGRALPHWLIVWDDFTTMLAWAGTNEPVYKYMTDILSRGAALGVQLALGTHNPTAKVIETFNKGLIDSRFVFHTPDLPAHQTICGGTGAYNPYWTRLDRPGRCLSMPSGQKARLMQFPQPQDLTALAAREWGHALPADGLVLPALTLPQYRVSKWSIVYTPGVMSRNKLAEAFDEKRVGHQGTADGGPHINEDELKDLQAQLRMRDLLEGGGRKGAPHRITPRLVELVRQCEEIPGWSEQLHAVGAHVLYERPSAPTRTEVGANRIKGS